MSFDARSEILAAIAKTNDQDVKSILLLLFGVLELTTDKIDGVADTLKTIMQNESALRHAVLNGHAANHHRDHEWLDKRIGRDEEIEQIVSWVSSKMEQERKAEEDQRKIRIGVTEKVIGSVLFGVLCYAAGRLMA